MAYSCLPLFPLIVFGIIEPALLIYAYIIGIRDPLQYYTSQAPTTALLTRSSLTPQAEVVTLQLLNVLLLLAPMAVICCWTTNPPTTKAYLAAVALADYGHIYATYRGLGREAFVDVANWNDMVWGSVGVSAVLNVVRLGTLMGVFGKVEERDEKAKRM